MRVGFWPSSKSNMAWASDAATAGTTPLISPQPLTPWFVLTLTNTRSRQIVARRPLIRMEEVRSATEAAAFWAADTRSASSAAPAAQPRPRTSRRARVCDGSNRLMGSSSRDRKTLLAHGTWYDSRDGAEVVATVKTFPTRLDPLSWLADPVESLEP